MKLNRILPALIIFVVLAINFAFGFPRLTRYSSVDEHLWTYDRTPQFWDAIQRHHWKSTHINDKPGITVALISGTGLLGINPKPYSSLRQGQDVKNNEQAGIMKTINFDFRLPIYLFTLLMAPVFYILLKKLFNRTVALFSIIMIYLSPILLGISLIINPDSLLWIFVPLTIIGFLLFQKNRGYRYACLSGFFLGLALLTKYASVILYPFLLFLIFSDYVFPEKKYDSAEYFKKSLIGYGMALLISTLTVAVLYPAGWADTKFIWGTTFLGHPLKPIWPFFAGFLALFCIDTFFLKNRLVLFALAPLIKYKKIFPRLIIFLFFAVVIFILINTYSGMPFYNFQSMLTLAKIKINLVYFLKIFNNGILPGTYLLIFSLTPLVFLFFVYSIGISLARKNVNYKDEFLPAFYMLIFILLYYSAFAANSVYPTVRYQISIYPLASMIAAVGVYQFISLEKVKKYLSAFGAYFLLIAISATSLILIKPYYFAYASDLLPKKYILNLNDMGDGSFEAAQYLNSLPNAQSLSIWSDKVAVCEYFVGKCNISLEKKTISGTYFDYFVVSHGREARSVGLLQKRALRGKELTNLKNIYLSNDLSDYKIEIGGRPDNFVKVVKNPNPELK